MKRGYGSGWRKYGGSRKRRRAKVKQIDEYRRPTQSKQARGDARRFPWPLLAVFFFSPLPLIALADMKQVATFDQDVQAFAISQDNQIVYAVQRMKRVKKIIVEHDDFWVGTIDGKTAERLLTATSSIPRQAPRKNQQPPPSDDSDKKGNIRRFRRQHSYQVDSLTWSPDSRRIAVKMDTSRWLSRKGPWCSSLMSSRRCGRTQFFT